MNTAHDVTRKARWAGALLISLSVALLALASAVLYAELRTPKAWDPLAAYPTQEIGRACRGPGRPTTSR